MLTKEIVAKLSRYAADEAALAELIGVVEEAQGLVQNQPDSWCSTAFAAVPNGITIHGTDGALLYFNHSALKILHIPPDESEQLDPRFFTWLLCDTDGEPIGRERFPSYEAMRTGLPQYGQLLRARLLNGKEVWLEVTAVPLFRSGEDRPYGVVLSFADVTRWKLAEAIIREQEVLMRQMAAHISDIFYIRELDSGQFLFVSPAYDVIWRQPHQDLFADQFAYVQRIHPDDKHILRKALHKFREDMDVVDITYRLLHDNGDIAWVRMRNFPVFNEKGEIYRIAGWAQDITQQVNQQASLDQMRVSLEQRVKERTAELRQANTQLRRLSQAKDEFISNVSHELKTPLTNIKLYLKLLVARPDKRERYQEVLEREANRLHVIVENLLSISRLDRGAETLEIRRVDLVALAEEYTVDQVSIAAEDGVALRFEGGDSAVWVAADRLRLVQVLAHLLTNALNYTPAGGCVVVRVDRREDKAVLSVQDTGHGFLPHHRLRLFERFFRGEAATLSQKPGTGLGLAIVQEIVSRHDGIIAAKSAGMGHGATFEIYLPLAAEG